MPRRLRRFATTGLAVAMVLALVASTGAVAYAADEAVPGDRLYPIDQAMEWAQLSLTSKPLATTELLLSFAEERLLEAEELSAIGDEWNLEVALDGYGSTIALVAQTLGRTESRDATALAALVDQSFSVHSDRLARIYQDIKVKEEGDTTAEEEEPAGCVDSDPHPVAVRLADRYGVSHVQIMAWFCAGYGFGDIMHALSTDEIVHPLSKGEEAGGVAGKLLARKSELGGWGLVWQELGLIGPRKDVPAGPPDDAGLPDDRPVGPPEDKPGRQPNGKPVGPPEDQPGTGPDGGPVGPPEDEPGREPNDKSSW